MSLQAVWYRLVRPDGSQLPNTEDSRVFIHRNAISDDLKTVVWDKNEVLFKMLSLVPSGLKPHKNQASFIAKNALRVADSVAGLGASDSDPVVIVVPESSPTVPVQSVTAIDVVSHDVRAVMAEVIAVREQLQRLNQPENTLSPAGLGSRCLAALKSESSFLPVPPSEGPAVLSVEEASVITEIAKEKDM
ncbi:hypothetical protein HK100_010040, partial [Physocladia obscura]